MSALPGSWPRLSIPLCASQWCPVASAHRLSQISNLRILWSPFRQCLCCLLVSLLLDHWSDNAGRHLTSVGNAPDPTNHMSQETVHPSGEKRDTGLLFVWLFKIQKWRALLPLRFFLLHGFSSNHLIICNMFYSENCELLMVLVTIELNASRQKWGHLMFPFPSAWFHTVAAHQPRFWNEIDVERVSDEPTRRAIEQKQVLNWLESLPLSSSLLLNPASMFWLAQSMSPLYVRKLKLR